MRSRFVGFLVCLLHWLPAAAWTGWSVESLSSNAYVFGDVVRLTSDGRPLVAYGGDGAYVAEWDGDATWMVDKIASAHFFITDPIQFELAAGDVPYVAWLDINTVDFHVARRDGAIWLDEVVPEVTPGISGGFVSLAIDPAGHPALSFTTGVDVKLARFDGSTWAVEPVASAAGRVQGTALAFGPDGLPQIAYLDDAVWLAAFDGAVWTTTMVDSGPVTRSLSFAVDAAGRQAIAYRSGAVVVSWSDGSGFVREVVSVTGSQPDVGWVAGQPAVAYTSASGVSYAARDPSGSWSASSIDSVASHCSLTHDALGSPVVSYENGAESVLKIARRSGASWDLDVVEKSVELGRHADLAFDPDGGAHLSVSDRALGLQVRSFDGVAWTTDWVERGPMLGVDNAMVFDAAGVAHVAYFDGVANDVKLARKVGAGWTVEVVDSAGDVGAGVDMALDALGRPAISYYLSGSSGELRVARWDGTAWTVTVLEATGYSRAGEAAGTSIGLDPEGRLLVAYKNSDLDALRLARWDAAGGWSLETVDTMTSLPGVSLAIDPSGEPALSYGMLSSLGLARWNGTAWDLATVVEGDPFSFKGQLSSLAFAPTGFPVIAFTATGPRGLSIELASYDGEAWSVEPIDAVGGEFPLPGMDLAFDAMGGGWLAFIADCNSDLRLARTLVDVRLHRAEVPDFGPGWRGASLPLTSLNDDETPPFPQTVSPPGSALDDLPAPVPLVMYRLLADGDGLVPAVLQAVKSSSGVELHF